MSGVNYYNTPQMMMKVDQTIITPQQVQKILDENVAFIHTIIEKQSNNQDCTEILKALHKNLIYLATHADQATSNATNQAQANYAAQQAQPTNQYQSNQNTFQTQPITPVSVNDGNDNPNKSQTDIQNKDDKDTNDDPNTVSTSGDMMPPPVITEPVNKMANQPQLVYQQNQPRMMYPTGVPGNPQAPPNAGYPPTQYMPIDPNSAATKFYASPYPPYGAYQGMYATAVPTNQHAPYQTMPMAGAHYPNQPPIMYPQQYPPQAYYQNSAQPQNAAVQIMDPQQQQQAQLMVQPNQMPPQMIPPQSQPGMPSVTQHSQPNVSISSPSTAQQQLPTPQTIPNTTMSVQQVNPQMNNITISSPSVNKDQVTPPSTTSIGDNNTNNTPPVNNQTNTSNE